MLSSDSYIQACSLAIIFACVLARGLEEPLYDDGDDKMITFKIFRVLLLQRAIGPSALIGQLDHKSKKIDLSNSGPLGPLSPLGHAGRMYAQANLTGGLILFCSRMSLKSILWC